MVFQCLFDETSMVLYTEADDAALTRLFSLASCLSKGESEPPTETPCLGFTLIIISLSMRLHTQRDKVV
ncbi:hypothetical protein Fmac_024975 [Flemingia macrophylla]|uniref:Uncharacterized protein n=1 Tax=Flemingia macrophylla TaxID=520843 RepID=A0ABD1LQX4_9FABA